MIKMFKNAGLAMIHRIIAPLPPGGYITAGPLRQRRGLFIADVGGAFLFNRGDYVGVQFC